MDVIDTLAQQPTPVSKEGRTTKGEAQHTKGSRLSKHRAWHIRKSPKGRLTRQLSIYEEPEASTISGYTSDIDTSSDVDTLGGRSRDMTAVAVERVRHSGDNFLKPQSAPTSPGKFKKSSKMPRTLKKPVIKVEDVEGVEIEHVMIH